MMNKISIITALSLIRWSIQAQKNEKQNVPSPVVSNVKWELEEGNYEVQYKQNDIKSEAAFSNTGILIRVENSFPFSNDPPPAEKKEISQTSKKNPKKKKRKKHDRLNFILFFIPSRKIPESNLYLPPYS
jgi:hypothetical protein